LLRRQFESGKPWDLSGEPDASKFDAVADRLAGIVFYIASARVDEAVGTLEVTDIGARVGWSLIELQGKFLLTDPANPGKAISLAPTLVGLVISGLGAGAGLLNIGFPVLIGFKLGGGNELILGPRLQTWLLFGAAGGSGAVASLVAPGATIGFAVASLGFGFTRPGFTAGASLAVPLAEQGAVAGVITAANGISYVLAPTIGISLYGLNHDLPFAAFALLLLGLVAFGRTRLSG
jgi:hypothetical protein